LTGTVSNVAARVVHVVVVVGMRFSHGHELATGAPAGQMPSATARAPCRGTMAAMPAAENGAMTMRLSARNRIPARVTGITRGEATANVTMDAGGVRLVASITVEAAAELGLAEGSEVTAIIKASDVIVGVPD